MLNQFEDNSQISACATFHARLLNASSTLRNAILEEVDRNVGPTAQIVSRLEAKRAEIQPYIDNYDATVDCDGECGRILDEHTWLLAMKHAEQNEDKKSRLLKLLWNNLIRGSAHMRCRRCAGRVRPGSCAADRSKQRAP